MEDPRAYASAAYRHEDRQFLLFAGRGSAGFNLRYKIDADSWEDLNQDHSLIVGAQGLELAFAPSCSFRDS